MWKREGNMQCNGSGEAWIIEKKSNLEKSGVFSGEVGKSGLQLKEEK